MAQILKSNQDKYVPTSTVNGKDSVLLRVAQHGDQLFEERGRNVQWAFGDGANQRNRLEGLRTEFVDWHAQSLHFTSSFTFEPDKSYIVRVRGICDLKWNRFHNKFGGKGRNIPLDLKKEQQNKVLKTMWKGLGSNLSEQSASRVPKALDSIEDPMSSIDTDCRLEKRQGRNSKKGPEESVTQILGDLMKKQVFLLTPGREGHKSFPKFEANLLEGLDYRDLHKWMTDHLSL
ncbi:Hypothetical predicted protein [Paramuricea clavata]|uniref:Uncharacterized protein n=1 Tax=Paramuricea clavata TaxID=317549 RepID=A0A7D9HI52_PARCT|nr:Hypothetical predicted protein [Paramuricea clavata]